MTLKTPGKWARELNIGCGCSQDVPAGIALVQAVREEFAKEAAKLINDKAVPYHRSNSTFDGQIAHGLNTAARLVESLVSTNSSEIPNSSTAPESTRPREALEKGVNPNMSTQGQLPTVTIPMLPINPEADAFVDKMLAQARGRGHTPINTVDYRGVQLSNTPEQPIDLYVWAVVYSNYEPSEIESLWTTRELAEAEASRLNEEQEDGCDWEVVRWSVRDGK